MLAVGDEVPAFSLKQTDGSTVKSSDWHGKSVVLFFYPEDDTPGCTVEACSLRDSYSEFQKKGVLVYGISPDGVESHVKFTVKFNLPYPLLADPGHVIADKFGVWVEKNLYGKKSMGIARTTFVIAPDGRIARVIKQVDKEQHAAQLLETL